VFDLRNVFLFILDEFEIAPWSMHTADAIIFNYTNRNNMMALTINKDKIHGIIQNRFTYTRVAQRDDINDFNHLEDFLCLF